MKKYLVATIVGAIFILCFGGIRITDDPMSSSQVGKCVFYNDSGDEIPINAVRLLVKSEFYRLTFREIDTITTYFPRVRHICPFIHCPMRDQIAFHGCGECEDDSECRLLDMAHWDNPTYTYDQCDSVVTKR